MSESKHLLSKGNSSPDPELTSALHEATLEEICVYFESSRWGLTSDQAKRSRALHGLNNIPPPIAAPAWLCCLLPCLLKTKSMEQYHDCVPEHAFVMRNKRWVKMDTASIVPGDVIRVEAGERVCADCRVLEANGCTFETSYVYKSANPIKCDPNYSGGGTSYLLSPKMAFLGYLCLKGSCNCIVVASGSTTIVSKLIHSKSWPPQ